MADAPAPKFTDLGLPETLLQALADSGYSEPTPIQTQAIPHLLEGTDLLGHAPTGTGKTAAFALPLLARIDLQLPQVQVLTLCPTRELAMQVAAAFQRYATHLRGCEVLPVYGGQAYGQQIQRLRRGVHIVVGTPGRVKDHLTKGTLKLDALQALVLDEADEMLRMGFIDDVEWIIEKAPPKRQMALFSATMPAQIQRIAQRHLHKPQEISVEAKTTTAETIRQRYWLVGGMHKLDALSRILEVEPCDGVLVFVRTRHATTDVAEQLVQRGFVAAPMNGDLPQAQREQMVAKFKRGGLDVLVATDVAARGLDVDRVSHVINYDIPFDTEAYVHRVGRTGRAGRSGEAILFVAPRERRMLRSIERATRQPIEELTIPSVKQVNAHRVERFKQRITDTLQAGDLEFLQGVVADYTAEHGADPVAVGAALARMAVGKQALQVQDEPRRKPPPGDAGKRDRPRADRPRSDRPRADRPRPERGNDVPDRAPRRRKPAEDSERFRLEVGAEHGVQPGNIVGAIANESGIDAQHIGHVDIQGDHSIVELPSGMPREVFKNLRKVWVCGRQLQLSRLDAAGASAAPAAVEGLKPSRKPNSKADGEDRPTLKKKKNDKKSKAGKAKKKMGKSGAADTANKPPPKRKKTGR